MNICLTCKAGKWDYTKTGKGRFIRRLIGAWEKMGVDVTQDTKAKVDIDLQISKWIYTPKNARKKILRCGPAHYDTNMKDLKGHNREHRKYLKRCDGAVYQSEFAKKMWSNLVGYHPKYETVIFNGADPEFYKGLEPYPSKYRYNFLASTREWVWEKRLKDIIESFLLADVEDSCLWIAGEYKGKPHKIDPAQAKFPKKYKGKNVKFLGQCDDKKVGQLYKMANALIHCVYIDAMPNSVCEAMVALCPVICSNMGGQSEVADFWGDEMVLNFDKWDFRPRDRRKPPRVDRDAVAEAIRREAHDIVDYLHIPTFLHIDTIAKQYLKFFERVLND